jgi:hypothetical protein
MFRSIRRSGSKPAFGNKLPIWAILAMVAMTRAAQSSRE